MGLVDGRILWDTMHDREHPLGVTYAQFYRFLTCADKNPCQLRMISLSLFFALFRFVWSDPISLLSLFLVLSRTWLTPDEATRNATTKRAMELSAVLEQAVNDQAGKYQNIELAYEEVDSLICIFLRVLFLSMIFIVSDFFLFLFSGSKLYSFLCWYHSSLSTKELKSLKRNTKILQSWLKKSMVCRFTSLFSFRFVPSQ